MNPPEAGFASMDSAFKSYYDPYEIRLLSYGQFSLKAPGTQGVIVNDDVKWKDYTASIEVSEQQLLTPEEITEEADYIIEDMKEFFMGKTAQGITKAQQKAYEDAWAKLEQQVANFWYQIPLTPSEEPTNPEVKAPAPPSKCSKCEEPFPYEAHESGKCYRCRSHE